MLISIIIPIYNSEKFLKECIESIIKQTYKDFEVILIDDGSKDLSGDICDYYVEKDCRFKVVHKENGGVSAARNLGIKLSKGEWILFIDSDDYVTESFVESFVNKINDVNKNVNESDLYKMIVFGSYIKVEKDVEKIIHLDNLNFSKDAKDKAIKYLHVDNDAFGYTCIKIFNSRIIKDNKLNFKEDIALSEDLIFTLEYLKYCNNIYVIDAANYYYRVEEGVLSKKKYDYLVMQKLIDLTEHKFLDIIAGSEYENQILQRLEDSRFCSLLNLFNLINKKYDTRFIVEEIKKIRLNNNFSKLKYENKSYKLLHSLVMKFTPLAAFLFIKIFFIIKSSVQSFFSFIGK